MARRTERTWRPSPDDFQRVFREQNPWHDSGVVPEVWAKPFERKLARLLPERLQADQPRRYQLILGPRRVGKTISMYQSVKKLLAEGVPSKALWWLKLDHPLLMQVGLEDLCRYAVRVADASKDDPIFMFLDELTYVDNWDLWLKTLYDEGWPLHIVGSSSSTAALLSGRRSESGVGRWEEQYLPPYLFSENLALNGNPARLPIESTLAETLNTCTSNKIDISGLSEARRKFLLTGGFPELIELGSGTNSPSEDSLLLTSQRTLRTEAVEGAVYKDIPQAFGVDNPLMLERLLYTLAGQTGNVLSPVSICQALGISQPTFVRYLSYLEQAYLVFTLPNYSGDESPIQKRGRALYFVDAAVRNAALQRGLAPLKDDGEMSLLIRNMVASHLWALGGSEQRSLYYWREKSDEVDLVFDHPESPLAFQIGPAAPQHRRGIFAFETKFPRFKGRCYIVSPYLSATFPRDNMDGIGTLPLDLFLLAVGGQAEKQLADRLLGK